MLSSRRTRWSGLAALIGGALGVAAEDAPPDATVAAIWQIERIEFAYHSTSVRYSCG